MQNKTKIKFGIFNKLLFLYLLSTALLFIFIILSYAHLQKSSFEKAFIDKSNLIRELLETTCIDPIVKTIAYDRTSQIIETLYQKNQEIAYIEIYDPTARVIASIGKRPNSYLSLKEITTQFNSSPKESLKRGQNQFITPLNINGTALGVIRVGITKKYLQEQLKSSILFFLGIFLIAIAITGLIYFIFTNRWISIPVIDVSNMMNNFADNDLNLLCRKIKKYNKNLSDDEIGSMAIAFEQMIVSITEHTQEKEKAEKKLAAEHERLLVTLRSIGDGVITSDINGKVVLLNKVAENLCGWSQAEAAGKPVSEVFNIVDERTNKPCDNPIAKILSSGKTITLDHHTVLIDKKGEKRNIADSGAPIRDPESRIIGTVLVFRDVTGELLKEKELLKARKLESVGILAAGIAHDFNNILVAVVGNLSLAREFIETDKKPYALVDEAEKAAQRAKGLTSQLLTFAKGGEPIKQEISLETLIMEPASFVLSGSNVAMTCNIPPNIWSVNVDPGQVSQVIQNLIINAKQAMPDGGKVEIDCTNIENHQGISLPAALNFGNYVRIRVRDSGIGMSAEIIENIFDPYFTTKSDGSGLGLAVCHSIITKHAGHISVESASGQGTIFTLYLPATGLSRKELQVSQEPLLKTAKSRIMIMDDEEIIREVAAEILMHMGHDVVVVSDGATAVELYGKAHTNDTPIDLIILDLTIPGGMGGQETVRKILEINPEAKVIVSSGYSNDPVMAKFRDYGFIAMVPKPFDFNELGKVISTALNS